MTTYTVDLCREGEFTSRKVEAADPGDALNRAYLEAGGGTWGEAVVCDAAGDLVMEATGEIGRAHV